MKKKTKKEIRKVGFTSVFFILILFLIWLFVFVVIPDLGPGYFVTKEVCGDAGCETIEIANNLIWINENTSFSRHNVSMGWLNENCLCLQQSCNIHYNYSGRATYKDNVSNTWYGPIEFTEDGGAIFYKPGTQIVQECEPCERYQCTEYEVIRK